MARVHKADQEAGRGGTEKEHAGVRCDQETHRSDVGLYRRGEEGGSG